MQDEERKQQSDIQAILTETYNKCAKYMIEFARRSGFSKDVAEDIVQDAFLQAMQKPEVLLVCENREAWMFEILKNYMGHYFRDAKYLRRLQQEMQPLINEMTEDQLAVLTLYKGMVDDEDLELLCKAILDGRSYAELSEEFGLKEPTLRKRIQRARDRFRKAYGDDE